MPARVQIKTETDDCIHLDGGNGMGSTICGLEMSGDPPLAHPGRASNLRINCPQCLGIIEACRAIPKRWIGQQAKGEVK